MSEYLASFILFFAVIDPIGTIPVYIAVTTPYDEATRRGIAFKATFFAALVLLFFVVAGEPILDGGDEHVFVVVCFDLADGTYADDVVRQVLDGRQHGSSPVASTSSQGSYSAPLSHEPGDGAARCSRGSLAARHRAG